MDVLMRMEAELATLKRQVQLLIGVVEKLRAERAPAPQHSREVWLAEAIPGVNEESGSPLTFPKTGNTFNLRLLDRVFTPTPGTQATTDTERTEEQFCAGRTIDGRWVYEDDKVAIVYTGQPPGTEGDKGEWWILDPRRVEVIKKTSDQRDGTTGYFPGKLLHFDPATRSLTEVEDIWIEDANQV
jgi:hypothetical protein